MAKTSMIQKDQRRMHLINKYAAKRATLRKILNDPNADFDAKLQAQINIQKLPVNSCITRLQRRCRVTGRPHAVLRRFGLSRNELRKSAMFGNIPGLKKASW